MDNWNFIKSTIMIMYNANSPTFNLIITAKEQKR